MNNRIHEILELANQLDTCEIDALRDLLHDITYKRQQAIVKQVNKEIEQNKYQDSE